MRPVALILNVDDNDASRYVKSRIMRGAASITSKPAPRMMRLFT